MTLDEFQQLCTAVCEQFASANAHQSADQLHLVIENIPIGIFFDPQRDQQLHCYADLGQVPLHERAERLGRALALNLDFAGECGEAIGFDDSSNHLLLRSLLSLQEHGEAATLVAACIAQARLAQEIVALLDEPGPQRSDDLLLQIA